MTFCPCGSATRLQSLRARILRSANTSTCRIAKTSSTMCFGRCNHWSISGRTRTCGLPTEVTVFSPNSSEMHGLYLHERFYFYDIAPLILISCNVLYHAVDQSMESISVEEDISCEKSDPLTMLASAQQLICTRRVPQNEIPKGTCRY